MNFELSISRAVQEFIAVEEAQSIVIETVGEQPVDQVLLEGALGRTLAETIRSGEHIPRFDNSGMDGYAVRAEDMASAPVTLRVVGSAPAGAAPEETVEPGTCVQIMTGAPIPEGADAVVPVEWTQEAGPGEVRIERAPEVGQYVRPAGEDVREGQVVFEAGREVTPPVIGMLAKLGMAEVPVRVPPTVAIVATGDELVEITETPGPGQIRNSNAPALAAQVRTAGGEILPPLRARDDKTDIRRIVEQALEADVLVFSGGVSVGEYDYVKQVLDEMDIEMMFWKVRQRPGKPLAFGVLQGKPVFGLPGNPVSSAICFEQYVHPGLARMLGRRVLKQPRHPATLEVATSKVEGLHYFTRGFASFGDDGRLYVHDTGPQASNIYSSIVKANCIAHLPESMVDPGPGTSVEIEWLRW